MLHCHQHETSEEFLAPEVHAAMPGGTLQKLLWMEVPESETGWSFLKRCWLAQSLPFPNGWELFIQVDVVKLLRLKERFMFYLGVPRPVIKMLLPSSCHALWRCPIAEAQGVGICAWLGLVWPRTCHYVHLLSASFALPGIMFPRFTWQREDKLLRIAEASHDQDLEVQKSALLS